ncbi:YihA family ribosome biogenesis GTP-binding protein [Acidaminobacter sp. JC074]|uniref:ribosome biogenesis GTP-binding protein YihA/YsxC n=1 Tax=Acidaminobacter sp. JC074 TaxID=2530199 RepID=UPI001F0F711A|nr:ribosome biogenesis GTP-binding protein YihA/YsxC [Acidaminobacter sp. JC074]MCH4890392.1 YihA family ribosome biogenesis GTP-binding protein [Acidaminobacter sp. JC074]
MKIKKSQFVTSAVKREQYPESDLPEIAVVGRSNVGKSSLINMLLNRKNLARTSSTPGKTQLINFFDIDGKFTLVDLPGYGYARVSKEQKKTWGTIIETYLKTRKNLLEVILLVDLRHKPTAEDVEMYKWIKTYGFNGIVVGTKYDKIKKSQLQKHVKIIRDTLEMEEHAVLAMTSTMDRYGKYEVWDIFNELFEVNGYDVHFERQQS